MVEVLAGRLLWAPESSPLQSVHGVESVSALLLCEREDDSVQIRRSTSSYRVPHYAEKAAGRAFGPLALDQVLRFCHNLDKRLNRRGHQVRLCTPPGDEADRSNAAVLLGAYLLLKCSWSVQDLIRVIGAADAGRKFVCSFAPLSQPEPTRLMKVSCCWEGLALARDQGWVDTGCISSELLTNSACDRYRRLADSCDAAWLIPGRVLVSADPVTTANDPNPATFTSVFPAARDATPSTVSTTCSEPTSGEEDNCDPHLVKDTEDVISLLNNLAAEKKAPRDPSDKGQGPPDFVSMLQECGISMVVRTNAMQESGMVERSYDGQKLHEFGIQHMDITLIDGGCPTKQDVRKMILGCADTMEVEGQSVCVHCKGGFGRSVLMACCLIIDRFDVPGAALLGWVRIARLGAVNTPRQERFLQSVRGRADLRKFMDVAHASCGVGQCSLQ